MSLSIAGAVVASPDVPATEAAWDRLGVALPVDVVTSGEGGYAGLVEVGLLTENVELAAALLSRRGLDVEGGLVSIAGVRWRLTEARPDEGVSSPPSPLDHVVVSASDPTRVAADYGARLGLDLRLDRDTGFGFRGLFFRCGDAVVEVIVRDDESRRVDGFAGLAWRCTDLARERDRLTAAGVDVSEIRPGRKPGTRVATVRDPDLHVPTLLIAPAR